MGDPVTVMDERARDEAEMLRRREREAFLAGWRAAVEAMSRVVPPGEAVEATGLEYRGG